MASSATMFGAAKIKSGVSKVVLTVAQTLRLQSRLGLSHTGLRVLRRELKEVGAEIAVASEHTMHAVLSKTALECKYYQGVELEGSKGDPLKCLVYCANICDAVARDLDTHQANGDMKKWPFTHHAGTYFSYYTHRTCI